MNRIRNTLAAAAAAVAFSMVAACGDVEPPTNDIGKTVEKQAPAPKAPVRTQLNRMDFGDGEATVPARPEAKARSDGNRSRLDFRDDGRG